MDAILTQLATTGGPIGVVVALAYFYIRQLQTQILDVQQRRVDDHKAMVEKLLDLNDKWNETINAQLDAAESQKLLLSAMKRSIGDWADRGDRDDRSERPRFER